MGVPQLEQCCCGCQLRTGTKFIGWAGVILGIICFIYILLYILDVAIPDAIKEEIQKLNVPLGYLLAGTLLPIVFSILLLIGVYKEKISYYLPWIIYAIIATVMDVVVVITMMFGHVDVGSIIGAILGICFNVYFILVVYSDYRQQKEHGQGGSLNQL